MRLKDKAIFLIGGASGIGASTAERLIAEGARVMIGDIAVAGAQALAKRLGDQAAAVAIDIADEVSVAAATDTALAWLGRLDGVHVNAADLRVIFDDSNALDVDLAVFDRTIAVNLKGHLLCTRAVLPHLLASGGGSIVYTSSSAAIAGEAERPSYAASKAGLNALMRHVASCWGKDGITANCIAPGFVMTPELIAGGSVDPDWIAQCVAETRSTRVGSAADIAGVAAMLLSEDGRWINGQTIHVNGGSLLS